MLTRRPGGFQVTLNRKKSINLLYCCFSYRGCQIVAGHVSDPPAALAALDFQSFFRSAQDAD